MVYARADYRWAGVDLVGYSILYYSSLWVLFSQNPLHFPISLCGLEEAGVRWEGMVERKE
jgi:hypothetical protein